MKWYFTSFTAYIFFFFFPASIYNLWLICGTVILLVFLFLPLISREKPLVVSQSLDIAFASIRPDWVPMGWGQQVSSVSILSSPRVWGCIRAARAPSSTGSSLGTAGARSRYVPVSAWCQRCMRLRWAHLAAVQRQDSQHPYPAGIPAF